VVVPDETQRDPMIRIVIIQALLIVVSAVIAGILVDLTRR
jgi:hypothetical protein